MEGRLLLQGSALPGRQWTAALAPIKKKKQRDEKVIKVNYTSYLVMQVSPGEPRRFHPLLYYVYV